MSDLTTVSTDLFNKIRSRFSNVKMGDKSSAVTSKESDARFFSFDYKSGGKTLGNVNISLMDGKLVVLYSKGIYENQPPSTKKEWYNFLQELRQFARKNRMTFDTRDMTKSNLDKRDYNYLANSSGETKMRESKLFGTSKTSYQDMGEAVIIVKHSQPVNYNIPAGRTQHIESIYIESANGERFKYPHKHLNGARAMARHIANGGTSYDTIGNYISGLSEELSKLRQFKNYTQRSGVMAEALGDLTERVIERIEAVKEEISNLQKQNYYEEFSGSFTPSESKEVPEDVMNSWVDALTIKTFNEELKSVFPYIYKLVSEKQDQGLDYDDLVAEAGDNESTCKDCHKDPCECEVKEDSHFQDFENHLENITTFDYDTSVSEEDHVEGNEFAEKVLALKSKGAKPGTKFTTSDGQEHTLKDAIELAGLTVEDFWTEEELRSDQSSGITNEIIEFITSMYDSKTGTFPRGEEGVKIAVEKKFGEHAGKFANFVVEKLSMKNEIAPALGAAVGAIGRGLASTAARGLATTAAKAAGTAAATTLADKILPSSDKDEEDEEDDSLDPNKKESVELAQLLRLSGMVK